VVSAVIFSTLFAKVPSKVQANGIVSHIYLLETPYGISVFEAYFYKLTYQRGDTNGGAPLHYLVVAGLLKYNYNTDAERIKDKYISLLSAIPSGLQITRFGLMSSVCLSGHTDNN